jgi:hypothetical protein
MAIFVFAHVGMPMCTYACSAFTNKLIQCPMHSHKKTRIQDAKTTLLASGLSTSNTTCACWKLRVQTLPVREAGPSGAPSGAERSGYQSSGAAHDSGASGHCIAPCVSPLYHPSNCSHTLGSATMR